VNEEERKPGTDSGPEEPQRHDVGPGPAADANEPVESGPESTPVPAEPVLPPADPVRVVEALLFAADEPLGAARIAGIASVEPDAIAGMVEKLNAVYAESDRTFRIHKVAQGYQLYTTAEYAECVRRLYQSQHVQRLSRAALEVLAIIAYNQPITRPEIEKLRGVDCSGPLLTLLERRLISTAGRAHRAGNPFLYRTTREFLRYFGLEKLEDLPRMEELGEFLANRETGAEPAEYRKVQTFDTLVVDYSGREAAAAERARQEPEPELPASDEPESSEP
jgi:segregation and condensation protein B